MSSPEPPTEPLAPPPQEPPRRLTRSTSDRYGGGVAGGLGRYFGVDPILFRIGFVVLTIAGGAGVLAYLALWLFVPDDGGERVSGNRATATAGLLILVFALWLLPDGGGWWWLPPGIFGLLVIAGTVYLIVRSSQGQIPRTPLTRALIVLGTVVGTLMLGVGAAIASAFGAGVGVAIVVIALGAAMVIGSFSRGRRWLLFPALALAAPLALVSAADLDIEGGVGDRDYRPLAVADVRDSYQLGAGEMWIDLRDVTFPSGETSIDVGMGAGAVNVLVPEDVCVSTDTRVGIGVVEWFDDEEGGIDVDFERRAFEAGRPLLRLTGDIDVGALRVDYDPDFVLDRHFGRFDDDFEDPLDDQRRQNCREMA